jgi:crotonobetainyl-CoA:carnitine CoA-transferase CaiB-like acyl-CoA transferase
MLHRKQERAVTDDFSTGQAQTDGADLPPGPLAGLRVIDASSLFAGPIAATMLADFGADVIKIEHPKGDSQRNMGWQVDGTSLMWTVLNRNKRCVTLDLHSPDGQEMFRQLCADADVVVENFRPGTLERWGIGYEQLAAINPRLVMVRVTAFGQTGPWKDRPGFGTIAEAMSGFAHINGHPDGPPTLPPFALGDAIAGIFGATSALIALRHRDSTPDGRGQSIDLSIFEPLFWILGPQMSVYDQLGEVQGRTGNRAPFTSPRNLYQAKDGRWIAISASAQSIAERLMRMVGVPHYIDEPWFVSHVGRLEHVEELDAAVGGWIGARTTDEVMADSARFEVAAAPIYNIEDIAKDGQYLARETFTRVMNGPDRSIAIQNVVPLLSETPGRHRWLGPALGAHNAEVFADLGYDDAKLAELERAGVIRSESSLPAEVPVTATTETGTGI